MRPSLAQKKGFDTGLFTTHRVPTHHTLSAQWWRSFVSGADDAFWTAPWACVTRPSHRHPAIPRFSHRRAMSLRLASVSCVAKKFKCPFFPSVMVSPHLELLLLISPLRRFIVSRYQGS